MVLAVEDIIREMRERPEVLDSIRRLVLTDELLELPERFDALTRVTEKNSADIAELTVAVQKNTADIAELTVAVRKNSADIAELTVTVKELVKMSAENTAAIKANADSLKRIEDTMGHYSGLFLEHSMPKILGPRLAQELSLRHPRARYHHNYWPTYTYTFIDRIEDLAESGAITEAQESRIMVTDLIMSARRKSDGEEVWIAAEASGLIGEKDINRAAESAKILADALKVDTYAVVIGHRISDIDRFRAEQKDVTVILVDRSEI